MEGLDERQTKLDLGKEGRICHQKIPEDIVLYSPLSHNVHGQHVMVACCFLQAAEEEGALKTSNGRHGSSLSQAVAVCVINENNDIKKKKEKYNQEGMKRRREKGEQKNIC